MDSTFLSNIRDNFTGNRFSDAALVAIAVTAAIIVLGVAAWLVWQRWARAPRQRVATLQDAAKVSAVLDEVLARGLRVELRFVRRGSGGRYMTARLADLAKDWVEFELSSFVQPSKEWIGRRMEVYLRLPPRNGDSDVFWRFESPIQEARRSDHGDTVIRMAAPRLLENRQKRAHLRIEPPRPSLQGMRLWYEREGSPGGNGQLPEDPRRWGQPAAELGDAQRIRLLNLSAGGLRLEAPTMPPPGTVRLPEFKLGERFLVRLDLLHPERGGPKQHYLVAAVQNVINDPRLRRREVGMKFSHVAASRPEDPDRLTWARLMEEEGVEAIDNWVFRRHLELNREKGLT